MRAISAARFRGAAGQPQQPAHAGPDHIGADQHQQPGASVRRGPGRARQRDPGAARLPAGDQDPPVRRVFGAAGQPPVLPAAAGLSLQPVTTLTRPSRRPCWLRGLSSGNGGASSRASTSCRVPSVAGHDEAAGRGGKRASSSALAPSPAAWCQRLAGRPPRQFRRRAGQRGVTARPVRTAVCKALGAIPRCRRRSRRRSRWRAWNASTASITSPGSGFRYCWVVDRCAWPITHCRSASGTCRVTGHPVSRRMTQVMQGPIRAQSRVRPGEHRPGRIVGQRPERPPQRPPQRLIPASRHQAGHLRLIQPQPHERIRGGGSRCSARVPLRITVISCWPGSASPAVAPSNSLARAPVDTQNATSARSRCEPSAANS